MPHETISSGSRARGTASGGVLWTGVALGVVGATLIYANARHASSHTLRLVEFPVEARAGGKSVGEFVAELDGYHEVELRFRSGELSRGLRAQVLGTRRAPSIDIQWTVTADGETVAAGSCQDYLYTGEKSFKRRLHDYVLGIAPHDSAMTGISVRGVGRFKATADRRYTIEAMTGEIDADLKSVETRLRVRLDRQFWNAHCAETTRLAYAGFVFLGLSFLALAGRWLKRRAAERRRHRSTPGARADVSDDRR